MEEKEKKEGKEERKEKYVRASRRGRRRGPWSSLDGKIPKVTRGPPPI